jgi:adenine-specific DNA-methyltransferase
MTNKLNVIAFLLNFGTASPASENTRVVRVLSSVSPDMWEGRRLARWRIAKDGGVQTLRRRDALAHMRDVRAPRCKETLRSPEQRTTCANFDMKRYNGERQYFADANGRKIDTIRQKIEEWKTTGRITESAYWFLLASLLESADKVANTASVYGAYLKNLKKTAQKEMVLEPANFQTNINEHQVFNTDSNELIKQIDGDILYLDPPYNERQYGANYHLLNTIARYDDFVPHGKTGLRNYQKSKYCSRNIVAREFENLIKNAKFKFIFLSYNNEGLMSVEEVRAIMEKYGTYQLAQTDYHRFKADKTENRNHKANSTQEYLHILEKT